MNNLYYNTNTIILNRSIRLKIILKYLYIFELCINLVLIFNVLNNKQNPIL